MTEDLSESTLLKRLLIEGSKIGLRIFRNQVGTYELKDGRWLTSGLCKGSSDLIGYVPVLITPAMVGRRVAVFVAVEAKGTHTRTTKDREESQQQFLDAVTRAGAFGTRVRSCDALRDAFADWLTMAGAREQGLSPKECQTLADQTGLQLTALDGTIYRPSART